MTRRRQCRHENTSDKYGDATYDWHGNIVYEVEYRECLDCNAWLALGPSSDTPDVEIEIMAAALAADRGEPFGCDRFEYCPHTQCEDLCALCEAYWLAHEINREVSQ